MTSDRPADRLSRARAAAGYETPTDAARRLGIKPSTYLGHENGSRGIKQDKAVLYARAFNVRPEWLLYGAGSPPEPTRRAPSGFSEPEVEPLKMDFARRAELRRTLPADDASIWTLRRAVPGLALLAGDVLIVALDAPPRPGDIALANVADLQTGTAQTVIRRYLPPWLAAAGPSEAPQPIDDEGRVAIRGVVRRVVRDLPGP